MPNPPLSVQMSRVEALNASPTTLPEPAPVELAEEGAYEIAFDYAGLATRLAARFDELARERPADSRVVLDAFLLAAGINQILDDYLHRGIGELKKVAEYVGQIPAPAGPWLGGAVKASDRWLRRGRAATFARSLLDAQRELAQVVEVLADGVAVGAFPQEHVREGLAAIRRLAGAPVGLQRTVMRPPACFVTFDQQPEDCRRLVERFAMKWPDRKRPVVVLGLRTSGSYLGPLCAAFLKVHGYEQVAWMTWRPGHPWLPSELRQLALWIQNRSLFLLADDPPASGNTFSKAAEALQGLGLPADSIVLLLQLFDSPPWWPWPVRLQPYASVTLPWSEWAIQEHLQLPRVREALEELLVGRQIALSSPTEDGEVVSVRGVEGIERVDISGLQDLRDRPSVRRHMRAHFRTWLRTSTGDLVEHHIYAKGSGLARFGERSLELGSLLEDFVPANYGIRSGLLFRRWLFEAQRLGVTASPMPIERVADDLAAYVAARRRRLPVAADLSRRIVGHGALWQRCSDLLSPSFGRGAPLARAVLHRVTRRLTQTGAPSVIDGSMAPSQWFEVTAATPASVRRLVKVNYDEHDLSAQTPFCYDPAFDLAAAAVEHRAHQQPQSGVDFGDLLRLAYEQQTGETISEERWVLYQLLQLRSYRLLHIGDHQIFESYRRYLEAAARQAPQVGATTDPTVPSRYALILALSKGEADMSRLMGRYLGQAVLGDVEPPLSGPICAIDVDGVLETGWLSFAATTPAGALALRALAQHGYRVVLSTGRSIDDVRDRCQRYRLAGGVAEYGAVIYNHNSGEAQDLLTDAEKRDLARVRNAFEGISDVYLDPAYRYSVRAYSVVGGRRTGVPSAVVQQALARSGTAARVRPVSGRGQTDVVIDRVDKGVGLRALIRTFAVDAAGAGRPLALAIGDTASDVPMFPLAQHAYAPAHADATVRRVAGEGGVKITSRPYQAGLLAAVSGLLGHRPGSCPTCRRPVLAPQAALLLEALAAQDDIRLGKLARIASLGLRYLRASRAADRNRTALARLG